MIDLNNPYYNFYSKKGKKYSTKLFAIVASGSEQDSIQWHLPYFEEKLKDIDLFVEPSSSLSSLYKKRAEQLRHDYDYLILHYSGGHDSHNILETFMYNGIYLDEILILDQFDRSFRKKLENINYELLHAQAYEAEYSAIPIAKYFIDTFSPKTKLTIVDNSFGIHARYWLNITKKQMIENLKMSGNIGVTGKPIVRTKDLNIYNSSFKKLKENKKVAHIWGRDKVIVRTDSEGYYITFIDDAITNFVDVNNILTEENIPQNIELFYTHPNNLEMIIKQAHLIIKKIPVNMLNPKKATRKYENMLADIIYDRKIQTSYLGLKSGDFKNWSKYMMSNSSNDLSFANAQEHFLFNSIDKEISEKIRFQNSLLCDFIKISDNYLLDTMSRYFKTNKFYIKKYY